MPSIVELSVSNWSGTVAPEVQRAALEALESGAAVHLPNLPFLLSAEEQLQLNPIEGSSKNISWDPRRGVRGVGAGRDPATLNSMLSRYADHSRQLLNMLVPSYAAALQQGNTSFRPVEIAGRQTSWRKDDTRLHVDSFPSSPLQGRRILRVFNNVNPNQVPRVWKLGEPFENVAQRFVSSVSKPLPGSAALLKMLGVTKSYRTAYDHYMLGLHDSMKADMDYQRNVEQTLTEFAPGDTWLVYTDQASHAALSGQYALEQTYMLPVEAMAEPARSPLKVLERLLHQQLV